MKKVVFLNIVLVFVFSSCALNGAIKGRVVYQNRGLQNAKVCVYQKAGAELRRPCLSASETDEDGNFSLNLKEGTYYLLVEKDDYFSYFGRNPVRVLSGNQDELTINCAKKVFSLTEVELPPDMNKPGVSGIVYYQDKPLDGAEVFFYLNMESDLRGPAYFSVLTDKHGWFYAPLESGTYYLVCRKRIMPERFGPIEPGDFFGYYDANPVSLQEGVNRKVVIYALKRETAWIMESARTVISGKVYNLEKKPVSGVYICLYKEDEMVGKPEYISNKTGEDGFFQINLVSGGKFYLIAKENFGAIPRSQDFIGYPSGSKDHSVEITTNKKLTGLEIIGEKILSR